MILFSCSRERFTPADFSLVRWLDKEADYELARWHWEQCNSPLSRSTWLKAHEFGYEYAAILEEGKAVSIAGVWRFSEDAWDVAAVGTLPAWRRKGYARQVVSFITETILRAGRLATCSTDETNMAMIATAKSVGFLVMPPEAVWWKYPELPDF